MKNKTYFILNLFFIILYVNVIYVFSQFYRNYMSETNYFLRLPKEIEIINLGSSHGMCGIEYPKEIKGYNLALNSQTLHYDLKILNKYKDNIKKGGCIIVPISIFSFYGLERVDNEKYYNFLEYSDIIGGNRKTDFLYKNFYIFYNSRVLPGTLKNVFNSIINRKISYQRNKRPVKIWSKEELLEEAIKTTNQHLKLKEVNLNYIEEIFKICKEEKFNIILVTTPQTYIYNSIIGKENYQERIYNNILKLKEEYDFIYLDYSHDNRFENNFSLFYDDDHLNEKGAKIFTKILLNDIKNYTL